MIRHKAAAFTLPDDEENGAEWQTLNPPAGCPGCSRGREKKRAGREGGTESRAAASAAAAASRASRSIEAAPSVAWSKWGSCALAGVSEGSGLVRRRGGARPGSEMKCRC